MPQPGPPVFFQKAVIQLTQFLWGFFKSVCLEMRMSRLCQQISSQTMSETFGANAHHPLRVKMLFCPSE